MPSKNVMRDAFSLLSKSYPAPPTPSISRCSSINARQVRHLFQSGTALPTTTRLRPRLEVFREFGAAPWHKTPGRSPGGACRTIFIQTESTPNADALKFLPNYRVLPEGLPTPFVEYLNPRATISPPHPSPLAARLMAIDGVTAVFYGADFITVTKAADAHWAHIRPEVFALITEAITSGQQLVTVSLNKVGEHDADGEHDGQVVATDSLSYDENDSEVVGMIKELLETRIRPAIHEDGGDIEFRGFENGYVMLKLRGACRTCDSSTVTLKNGIEGMLMHYVSPSLLLYLSLSLMLVSLAKVQTNARVSSQIEEVKGVHQVMDQEEEVAIQEFAKFEERLKQHKEVKPPTSNGGKHSLDTVPD